MRRPGGQRNPVGLTPAAHDRYLSHMRDVPARLAVDIGGTFTDVALEQGDRRTTSKVLTTPDAPEQGVMTALGLALERAGLAPSAVGVIIHGTTLATNAIIERKGARTALLATAGFRDAVEMAYEHRFEQYDIFIERPPPLVPRYLRLEVPERIDVEGRVLRPLDERAVARLAAELTAAKIESVAVGLLHSYVDPMHEQRIRDILRDLAPDLWITLSSDVCPELREYERFSTACANAYIQPRMATYLRDLDTRLKQAGFACPLLLMTSGGGLTTLETAARFPIRLVESGPAGGAILASHVAAECGFDRLVSFDMGGTTAKLCLIDDGRPQTSRVFEVARQYRFLKGSGLPLRIPVIEMVEIGAGGGSIATVDELGRIAVGPQSAGAEPGPACYGRGGSKPTVTDADLALGRIDPERFAGGDIRLHPDRSRDALAETVGRPLGLDDAMAAFGVSEVVEENMANAARVHAVERGKDLAERTLIAFGGAAPLHAGRLAEKLGIGRIVVPAGAGVGSAIGFLRAPVAYEVVRSRYMALSRFDAAALNRLYEEMAREATTVVRQGAPEGRFVDTRTADMRYRGQGHEISVPLPGRAFAPEDAAELRAAFDRSYAALFGRTIPGLDVEVLSWTLAVAEDRGAPARCPPDTTAAAAKAIGNRRTYDPAGAAWSEIPVYWRPDLAAGARIRGPAVIAEAETSTLVTAGFTARINALGYIVMERI
jgi:N-methylhydantoinase A